VLCAACAPQFKRRQPTGWSQTMKAKVKDESAGEVLGIVILRGKTAQVEPRLSLYMWCDESNAEPDSTTKAA
jgi:hypothetical protein